MRYVAVFFHPFKKFEKISKDKWKATHFRCWYKIYSGGVFIADHLGKIRSHTGISPNTPHFIAMAEALCDPCFDRFDDSHTTICLVPNHDSIHLRLQSHLLGRALEADPVDGYGKTAKSALALIDRKRTVSMHAEKGSKLRSLLPNRNTIFDYEPWIKSDQGAFKWQAALIDDCCARATDRHRDHLLRVSKLSDPLPFD